ncbi:MAG: hypothetical protein VYE04_08680 [Pseudomonadota bacterium]|nr:hypothetical protein [Pseudomonadota bacterium]
MTKLMGWFAIVVLLSACAPITPLPGGGISTPTPPSSSGGSSGSSGGGSSGGGSSGGGSSGGGSSGGGSSGGGSSGDGGLPGGTIGSSQGDEGQSGAGRSGGGQSSGDPSSSDTLPGGNSTVGSSGHGDQKDPGGSQGNASESGSGTDTGGTDGADADIGWEDIAGTEQGADDGWETSNSLPGEGEEDGQGGLIPSSSVGGQGNPGNGDEEFAGALEEFDGEILSERQAAQAGSGVSNAGRILTPEEASAGGGSGDSQQQIPLPQTVARTVPLPPPPRRGSENIPDDLPDAKDDDIIARQLREAAMQETDPDLKEKLWEEYRKYKKG